MTESISSSNEASLGSGSPERDLVTLQLLADGDPEGLQRMLADHGDRVRVLLRKEFNTVLDALEIEDAVNQAGHRVWRFRQRLDLERGTLRAWFLVIARNCACRLVEVKRGRRGLRLIANIDARVVDPASVGEGAIAATERDRFARDLHLCIAKLPAQQRAVVLADLAAGGTAETEGLVKELKTTPGALYVARTNARKALRVMMIDLGHAERQGGASEG